MDFRGIGLYALAALEGCANKGEVNKDYEGSVTPLPKDTFTRDFEPIFVDGFDGRAKAGFRDFDGNLIVANTDQFNVDGDYLDGDVGDAHAIATFDGAKTLLVFDEGASNPLNLKQYQIVDGELVQVDDNELTEEMGNGSFLGGIDSESYDPDEVEAEGMALAWDEDNQNGAIFLAGHDLDIWASDLGLREDGTFDLGDDIQRPTWHMSLEAALSDFGIEGIESTISGLAYVYPRGDDEHGYLLALIEGEDGEDDDGQSNGKNKNEAMVVQIDWMTKQIVSVYGLGTYGNEEDIFVDDPTDPSKVCIVIDEKENGDNPEHVADCYEIN